MNEKKRMIENYEVRHSVFLGDHDVLGVADMDKLPRWAKDAAQKLQRQGKRKEPEQ